MSGSSSYIKVIWVTVKVTGVFCLFRRRLIAIYQTDFADYLTVLLRSAFLWGGSRVEGFIGFGRTPD